MIIEVYTGYFNYFVLPDTQQVKSHQVYEQTRDEIKKREKALKDSSHYLYVGKKFVKQIKEVKYL